MTALLTDTLEQKANLRFAYLYGSRASEEGGSRESDYDIAVYPDAPLNAKEKLSLIDELNLLLDAPVDLTDLRNTTTVLAKEIVTKGQLLFAKDITEAQTFDMQTRSAYVYLNQSRRESLEQNLPKELLPNY